MICDYDEGWNFIMHCENCTFTACRWCYSWLGWFGAVEAVNDMEPETAQEAVARYQIREIRGRRGNEAKRRRVEAVRCNSGSQQAGSLNAPGALKRKR
jgi:hypothetical protein